MSNYYTGLRPTNLMPNASLAYPMGTPGFVLQPQAKPIAYGEMRFGQESNESLQNIIKGLNSAVDLLTQDDPCQPNACEPRRGSWCFPEVNYTCVPWRVELAEPQPTLCFSPPAYEATQTVSRRITNFFCR